MRILRTRSETVVLHCLHRSSNTRRDACFESCTCTCTCTCRWRSNVATSLRIFACATPEAQLSDKNFSASGQAASKAPTCALAVCRRSAQTRRSLHRSKKTAEKKRFFESAVAWMLASVARTWPCAVSSACFSAVHWDGWLKKKCKRVLTVKKSVIRFRPADIAAEESEQNRHQADTLVPDVHRSAIHGGVGFASYPRK